MMPDFDIGWPRTARAANNKTIISICVALDRGISLVKDNKKEMDRQPPPEPGTRLDEEIGVKKTKKYVGILTISVAQTFNDGFRALIKNANRSVIASADDPPSLQGRCYMEGHIRANGVLEGLLLMQGGRSCGYLVAINAVNKIRY